MTDALIEGQSWQETLADMEREREHRQSQRRLADYAPYPKQLAFHAAGRDNRERLFMAGNQLGKTLAGAMELAMHATGRYPAWWEGRRFDRPTVGWAAGITGESTRDTVQRLLLGRPGAHGTGALPADALIDTTAARGAAELVDSIRVRHASGGTSRVMLKSYEKGREKWQGETVDYVWFDEEPPVEVYTEGLARIGATRGMVWTTFTPLKGMSAVVARFLTEHSADRAIARMSIEEVGHFDAGEVARVIAAYPAHEREARANGVPTLGSGRVFPVGETSIRENAIAVPKHWPRIAGIDFGWDHPTAVVWLAWDRDADTVHVTDCYRLREQTPAVHAAAIRARGVWIPIAWPHDALAHDKTSGQTLAELYRSHGLNLLPERAQFEDGGSGLEAGVIDMLERMQTGRLKVAANLADWWEEFRLYHRKAGRVVGERDDLIDATRYALMMLRHAATESGPWDGPIDYGPARWIV